MSRAVHKGVKPLSCFTCQWRDRSEWCVLRTDDLEHFNQAKTCSLYRSGQVIYSQGQPSRGIYCIEDGAVALRRTDAAGNSVLVRIAHAGQTLGYRDYFAGREHTATAEALLPASICFVERAEVSDLLSRNPALGLSFLARMADDLESAEERMLQSASLPVRARFAHLLLTLKERYGEMDADGALTIHLPLARQDIAAMLGTRPETVARTISVLEEDDVAHFSGRTVVVPDLDALLDEIEVEEAP